MKNIADLVRIVDGFRWLLRGRSSGAAVLQTLLVRLLTLVTNLVTGIITARTLGPLGRGEQAAMILWPQFLAYAMTLGVPRALVYNIKSHPEEESELFSAALLLGTGLGVIATVIGIAFIPIWLNQYSPQVILIAQWFMITAPLALLGVIFTSALEAQGNFTTANQTAYLSPLITLGILGALALTHALTPSTAGLAYLLPSMPIFLWILIHLWNHYRPRWRGLGPSYKRLISYGLRSYGIDLLGTLAAQVDQVLVVGLLTPASLGLYVVALNISRTSLNVLQSSIITVLLPKVVARPVQEVVSLTGRAARIGTALTFLAAVAMIIISPLLLRLLYGAEYVAAIPVFRFLVLEVMLSGTTWTLAQAFMALGRPGTITILQGIGLGLTVPLLLVLLPAYGLVGVGIALLCSTTIRLLLVLASYPLFLKVRPPSLVITWEDWLYLKQMLKKEG